MRKEIIYAILAGVLFGLVVAFGIWRANSSIRSGNQPPSSSSSPSPTAQSPSQISITIAKPENYSVTNMNTAAVNGLTSPESWVVVSGESDDYVFKSKDDGSFVQEVELVPGVNEIITTSFNGRGDSSSGRVVIVYSSEFKIPEDGTRVGSAPSSSQEATDSPVRQKVQEKVEKVLLSPKAYLGTITDISEGTIQINKISPDSKEAAAGEIKQISIPTNTVYIKSQKGEIKSIKLSDVAIGDFIVAMGFVNGNQVLEAQRVLITDELQPTPRTAKLGSVTSVLKTKFKLKSSATGEETEVVEESGTKITKDTDGKTTKGALTDIKEGVTLIAAGKPDIKNFFARRIHIISSPVTPSPTPKAKTIN